MINAISTDRRNFENITSELLMLQQRVRAEDFTSDEIRQMKNMNLSNNEIDSIKDRLLSMDITVFSASELINDLQDIQTNNGNFSSNIDSLLNETDSIIQVLSNDENFDDKSADADAGGPYIGIEGQPIVFNGTMSSGSTIKDNNVTITEYHWDLNGDGRFDDATGPIVSFTYLRSFDGIIGLRVLNEYGFSDIDYVSLSMRSNNLSPTIEQFSPASAQSSILSGSNQTYILNTSRL